MQRKCSHVEAIFASISSQLGIRKRLVRRLNQPMTVRLMKTARSLKVPHEIVQILFPAALPPRLPWLGKKHEEMISFVKRCHMMCHVKITWVEFLFICYNLMAVSKVKAIRTICKRVTATPYKNKSPYLR